MNVVTKPLSELQKPEKNVRRHTKKQLQEYVRSLEMFGQIKPIVVDETGEIIAGNGLYDALVRMGAETCECCVVSGLSQVQKRKLMLADNRVYELGITDMDIFDEIIKELGGDIDVPGWDADLLETLNANMDEVADMVESYGVFNQDEVDTVNKKQREDHVPTVGRPLQPPVPDNMPTAPPPTYPKKKTGTAAQELPTAETGGAAEPVQAPVNDERFVICPKCGERICL